MVVQAKRRLLLNDLRKARAQARLTRLPGPGHGEAWAEPLVLVMPQPQDPFYAPGHAGFTVNLANAGLAPAVLSACEAGCDWLTPPDLPLPMPLPDGGRVLSLPFALRPEGLHPGDLHGAIRLVVDGREERIPVSLVVPAGAVPWLEQTRLHLSTRVREHEVTIRTPPGGRQASLALECRDEPQPVPRLRRSKTGWETQMRLYSGLYGCTVLIDSLAVRCQAGGEALWTPEESGRGALLVGNSAGCVRLRNVGDTPVDLRIEGDQRWLWVRPAAARLDPGAEVTLTIADTIRDEMRPAATGCVRVRDKATGHDWALIRVDRDLRADIPMPVVDTAVLSVSALEGQPAARLIDVQNAGDQPLTVSWNGPGTAEAPDGVLTVPARSRRWLRLTWAGEWTARNGDITGSLVTNSPYPGCGSIPITTRMKVLSLAVEPQEVDFGQVLYLDSRTVAVGLRQSDGRPIRSVIPIPDDLAGLFSYADGWLTCHNRLKEPLLVQRVLTVTAAELGVSRPLRLRADCPVPRLQVARSSRLTARPGTVAAFRLPLADAGKGLQVFEAHSAAPWLDLRVSGAHVDAVVRTTARDRGTRTARVSLVSNDPARPTADIDLLLELQPDAWMRLLDALRALVPSQWANWLARTTCTTAVALLLTLMLWPVGDGDFL